MEDVRARDARLQPRRAPRRLRACSASRASCRSTRRASARCRADSSFNTAVSFATNTNWQGYGGETTMSYLTQMLGADGAELRLGGGGHGGARRPHPRLPPARSPSTSATSGSTSSAARSTSCCRSRSCSRSSWSRRAWCRTSAPTRPVPLVAGDHRRRRQAGHRAGAADGPGGLADRDQAARHQRRRLLQRQLGAPVREPDAARRTSSRCWRSC